jgi:hypothetical protein
MQKLAAHLSAREIKRWRRVGKAIVTLLVAAVCLDVALARAKRLDAQGNRRACMRALAAAKPMYNF